MASRLLQVPFTLRNVAVGALCIGASNADAAFMPEPGWGGMIAMALVAAAVVFVIAARRASSVARQLDAISSVVLRARQGDPEARVRVEGPAKVAALAAEVNRLLEQQRNDDVALRGSEERFRSIADSSPAFIWMAGPDGKCEFVNAAWLDYTGRTLEEERGDGWGETLSRYDREHWSAVLRQAWATRQPFRIEYRRGRHDGAYRWFVDSGTPRYDGQGHFVGFIGTCIDIHERALADLRVRRMADMYSALSQTNAAMAKVRESDALLQQACQILIQFGGFAAAWVGMLGADRRWLRNVAASGVTAETFGRVELGSSAFHARADYLATEALGNGQPAICNDLTKDVDATSGSALSDGSAVRSAAAFPLRENGAVAGVLAVYSSEVEHFDEEMTSLLDTLSMNLSAALDTIALERERNAAEAALRDLNATLEDKVAERTRSLEVANRELEAFSYSVSHDLRAPLRSISGFTDLVLQKHGEKLDQEARDKLARVKAAGIRMTALINDLLNLARISRTALHRSRVNLSEIATSAIEHLRESDRSRIVDARIEPDLTADVDPGLARVLLVNLLDNAWKFTSVREHAVIEFGRTVSDEGKVFFVRDNGVGFDMAYAHKLFAPFQRLHGEREFPGNGIGLAIVQPIVQRHGGRIWAAGKEGAGATFSFTLGA